MNNCIFRQVLLLLAIILVLPSYSQDKRHYVSLNQNEMEWTITHGDDVLFHGTGHVDFNNMPPFIKYVVDSLDAIKPVNRVKKNAGMNHAPATTIVEPLITTSWDQGAPYNDLMPTINGVHVPAGCSTISTAQVVNYYRYMKPWTVSYDQTYSDSGVMEHNNITRWYDPSEVSCPMPVYHVDYSFNGWSDNLSPAELCEAIAFAQQASFSSDETGTFFNYQSFAIQKRFGYLTEVIQTDFLNVVEPLKTQLNQQRPVIINATDNNNMGHSFIADGYNSEGEFHLNLGWGESWNCWSTPELWTYNQGIYAITLYPDYNDEGLFLKEDEAGTAVFHNLTTGEVFKQEMELVPSTNVLTGLFVYDSNIAVMQLSAGEYEYCLEYESGKQISVPMPVPSEYELYTFYSHYSPSLVKGTSRLSVPHDCRLTFYSNIDERFGGNFWELQVILEQFHLESYSVGEVEFNLTNRDSTLNILVPTEYSEKYWEFLNVSYGEYKATIENIPAGYYQFSANVHSKTLGEFSVGIGAGAFPCTGNYYVDLLDLEDVLWYGSIYEWTDASNPFVEPLMFKLPRHNTKGSYTLDLSMGTGAQNVLEINAKWIDELDENGNVIYVISPVVEEGMDINEENAEDITEFKLALNEVKTFEVNEDASAELLIDGVLKGTAGKDDISEEDGVVTIKFNFIDNEEGARAKLMAFWKSVARAAEGEVSVEVIIAAGSFNINGEDVTEDISYSYTAPASVAEEIEENLSSVIHGIAVDKDSIKVYNLNGVRVSKNQKGIVIKKGKVFFVK
ncbi:MAG: C10 family peptidase [Bacteroidaceae bacterium]|nr:C10 family peptidase [Bacteroidaceae bacterium]